MVLLLFSGVFLLLILVVVNIFDLLNGSWFSVEQSSFLPYSVLVSVRCFMWFFVVYVVVELKVKSETYFSP